MNGLFRGEYSTPGSICYIEPSSLLFPAHHKLQALVDWGCNPGAPLGPLASFSEVQAFLTDKVIRSLFSVLGLGSLWNIFARWQVLLCVLSPVDTLQHGLSISIWSRGTLANGIPSPPLEQKQPRKEGSQSTPLSPYPFGLH